MWSQSCHSGGRYYREHRNSRSLGLCPAASGSIPCEVTGEQASKLMTKKLHRLAQAYVDGHYPKDQYRHGKHRLELEPESLLVPVVSAAEEAVRLLSDIPALWRDTDLEERRKLLMGTLDAVYVDTKELKQVVAIHPKPAFGPVFQEATTREGSEVVLINEPLPAFDKPEAAESALSADSA